MTITRIACLFGALILLNSCGGIFLEDHFVPDNAVEAPETAGYLVGSIGYYTGDTDNAGPTKSLVMFRRIGTVESGFIKAERGFLGRGDFKQADRTGKVFALPLKPGEYEFYNVKFSFIVGTLGYNNYMGKEDFSVPFTIEENKVHYAGEFLAFGIYGKNIIGIPMGAGGYFAHGDNFERDLELIRAKYPELPDNPIEILETEFDAVPLIVSELD